MGDVYEFPDPLDESWIDDWLNEDVDDPEAEALYPADPDILRDITNDETRELPAVSVIEPGSWDELVALNQGKLEEPLTMPEAVAWRLDTEPLTTPEGDTHGYALYCTRFPDSADPVPEFDTPQRAERLEMAHFASEEQAQRFETEFRSYLVPGLIDVPELAEEVAKLEGMPGEWETLEGDSLKKYQPTHDPAEWQLYNPKAKRDAQFAAEGLSTSPIHQFRTFDEGDPKVEPAVPDFDL